MSQQSSKTNTERMEKIVSLCKERGFVFQSSEIYGGLNGCWDYGPLGVELKRNLKEFWWRRMTRERDDIVGLDGSILMNRRVWQASGHEARSATRWWIAAVASPGCAPTSFPLARRASRSVPFAGRTT